EIQRRIAMRHRIATALASALLGGILWGASVASAQPFPVGAPSQPDGQPGPAAQWPSGSGIAASAPSSATPDNAPSDDFVCNRMWRTCQYGPGPWDHPNSDLDDRVTIFVGR